MEKGTIFVFVVMALMVIGIVGLFFYFDSREQIVTHTESVTQGYGYGTPSINSNQLRYNNVTLTDNTIYDSVNNICTGENLGMKVQVYPCKAEDIDGRDIKQYVNLSWEGNNPQDVGFIFVYDGQLENGKISLWDNRSYVYNSVGVRDKLISNYLVYGITGYTNVSPPDQRCQIGNIHNTQMYLVNRTNTTGTSSNYYCFSSVTPVNATAFRITGNIDESFIEQKTGWREEFYDVSQYIDYLGQGLLGEGDTRTYYKVDEVAFQPHSSLFTQWEFTPVSNSLKGKWHILAYNKNQGFINAIANDQYLYLDPWWDSNWQTCIDLNVTGGIETISDFPFYVNLTYDSDMQTDMEDVRVVSGQCNNAGYEVPYEFDKVINSSSAGLWARANLTTGVNQFSVYYNNPSAINGQNPAGVWKDYIAVYHLSESGKDSLGKRNLTSAFGTPEYRSSPFGSEANFTGTNCMYGPVNLTAEIAVDGDRSMFVIGKFNAGTGATYKAVAGYGWSSSNNNWDFGQVGASSDFGILANGGSNDYSSGRDANLTRNSFYLQHISGVTQMHIGKTAANTFTHTYNTYQASVYLGCVGYTEIAASSESSVDEFRVANKSFSSAYINRTQDNMDFSLFAFGAEASQGSGITAYQSYPENSYNSTNDIVNFACNFSGPNDNITSVSLNLYDSSNNLDFSNTEGSLNISSYNKTWTSTSLSDDSSYKWECFGTAQSGAKSNSGNRTLIVDTRWRYANFTNTSYNHNVSETSAQNLSITVKFNPSEFSASSGVLFYNGTQYASNLSVIGNNATFYRQVYVPNTASTSNISFYWVMNFVNSTGTYQTNSTSMTQQVYPIYFTICNSTYATKYLNITFMNETALLQRVPGQISSSTFKYYLATPTVYETYTYQNLANAMEYDFCFSAPNQTVYGNLSLNYLNLESPQRSYSENSFSLTNNTAERTLFLLPYLSGVDITFQIVSPSQSPIPGAIVNYSTGGATGSGTTDSAGAVTFFMNPTTSYTVCASATGYTLYCGLITPTQAQYTIQLGSSNASAPLDYLRGITASILPSNSTLVNDTTYTFAFTIDSNYWALTEYGFVLRGGNGTLIGSASDSTAGGGTASANLNVGSHEYIVMYYYWLANGTYTNLTRTWVVLNTEGTQYSINNFLQRFKYYTGNQSDADGLFGLKTGGTGDFSMVIISFVVILLGTGIASYRYGINNVAVVMAIFTSFVYFFDVVLDVIPEISPVVTNLPTIIVAFITVILIIREEMI